MIRVLQRMFTRSLLPIGLLGLSLAVQAAPDTPEDYRHLAPLQLAPGEGVQAVTLPWQVLQAARSPGLNDLRIFDGDGQQVPMAWLPVPPAVAQTRSVAIPRFAWPKATVRTGEAASSPSLQLRLGPGGAVLSVEPPARTASRRTGESDVWLLDLSALTDPRERLSRVEFDWPVRDDGFAGNVAAEASDDGQRWRPVTETRLLALAPNEAQASGPAPVVPTIKHIAWPADMARPRYVRLRFDEPLGLTSSRVVLREETPKATLTQQTLRFEPVAAAREQPAAWQIDLQGAIAPAALELQLPDRNTLLQLRLDQRQTESGPWRTVARFGAWRVERAGQESRSDPVFLQVGAARFWRLVPEPAVSTALASQPLAVTWSWQAPRLVFLAQGSGELKLAVGREQTGSAARPVSTLMATVQDKSGQSLPEARLGKLQAQEVRDRSSLADASPETLRRWALWAVLVAAVGGLGLLAGRMLKDIQGGK